jgi:hypothetical protein
MHNKKIQTIFVIFLILFVAFLFFNQSKEIKGVVVGGKNFSVEVARTEMERARGLSLHVPLLDDQGMLFIFEKEGFYGFWMKDMSFSIDILWIDPNFKVKHIEKNISPDTYPKIFTPETENLYVLEISAGQADFLNIKIGDSVKFVKK